MDSREKQKIEQQLIAQAEMIRSQEDDTEILMNVLNSCQALLRIAGKTMPQSMNAPDLQDILSVYLGLTTRIKYFYQTHEKLISEADSALLNNQLAEINRYQKQKRALEVRLEEKEEQLSTLKQEMADAEKQYNEMNGMYQDTKSKRDALVKERTRLKAEKECMQKEMEDMEPVINELTDSVLSLKDTYREMRSHYPALERIEKGISEDGYVDMQSFSKAMREMDIEGKTLLGKYDQVLSNLLQDIEETRKQIEIRRKNRI